MVRYAFPTKRGHNQVGLGRWTPMFPGSHDMLVRENEELDRLQLPRISDEYELLRFEAAQELVPVPETDALKFAPDLLDSHRYCRPWTRDFLQDFSEAYYEQFHSPIQINSLVRTVEQQHRLRRWNRFAAPEVGDTASTHLTGVTFDMSRRGLNYEQYEWIRNYLLPLQTQGMVDPIEERQPVLACGGVRQVLRPQRAEERLVRGQRAYGNGPLRQRRPDQHLRDSSGRRNQPGERQHRRRQPAVTYNI